MANFKILDCTLRDGGYINDWNFDKFVANEIFSSLVDSKVEILECGYLSTKKAKNNSTLFESIDTFEAYFIPKVDSTQELVLMINQGDYNVKELPKSTTNILSGIRLAFHKKNLSQAISDAKIIIEKGYKLYFQPMVVKSYSDEEFINLIQDANKINPYAFYIVDSFGSLDKREFLRYFAVADHLLNPKTTLGFHGHNNMQFVYGNTISLIETTTNRPVIADSSIFGMGRGAGNLNTEIILNYLNKYYGTDYIIEPLLEVMDDYLEELYTKNPWGFTPAQFLSAKHECHPNYATHLTSKKKLSVVAINEILSQVDEDKKLSFNSKYIEELYLQYNLNGKIDNEFSIEQLNGKNIILVGSGKSITKNEQLLQEILAQSNSTVVILNHMNEVIEGDYYFFSNTKRYEEYKTQLNDHKTIITSNIRNNDHLPQLSYGKLLTQSLDNYDNVLTLFLSFLEKNNFQGQVYLAGIDGYDTDYDNYASEKIVLLNKNNMLIENKKIQETINFYSKKLHIEFLTPSIFKIEQKLKTIGVIPARYKSSRFEGKPLCIIDGIPMIKRTYQQVLQSKLLDAIVIATEDERIENYCKKENIPVIMTSDNCLTGTDRIAEVSKIEGFEHYDLYVNIQGDEPVIDPSGIDQIINEFKKYGEDYIAYNLYKREQDIDEVNSNTIIKSIVNEKDELMYMSRLPVPFNKSSFEVDFKKQVCVYGFTKQALDVFSSRDKTLNEKFEDIEILRFVDMGFKVKMKETFVDSIAVDIPSDIKKVENFLERKGYQ